MARGSFLGFACVGSLRARTDRASGDPWPQVKLLATLSHMMDDAGDPSSKGESAAPSPEQSEALGSPWVDEDAMDDDESPLRVRLGFVGRFTTVYMCTAACFVGLFSVVQGVFVFAFYDTDDPGMKATEALHGRHGVAPRSVIFPLHAQRGFRRSITVIQLA